MEAKNRHILFLPIVFLSVYSIGLFLYLFLVYSFDNINKRSLTDSFISTFLFLTPLLVGIYYVKIKKLRKKIILFLHFLWSFALTSAVGVYLLMTYCQGEECLANLALIVANLAYHLFVYLLFALTALLSR